MKEVLLLLTSLNTVSNGSECFTILKSNDKEAGKLRVRDKTIFLLVVRTVSLDPCLLTVSDLKVVVHFSQS